MSDPQSAGAAGPSGREGPAIAIEALVASNGLFEGIRQPSLGVRLLVRDPRAIPAARVQAAFGKYAASGGDTIVEQTVATVIAVLRHLRFPIFADPLVRELADNRWDVRLPAMQGLQGRLAELTTTVVAILAALGDGQHVPEETRRKLKDNIALLQTRAPVGKVAPLLLDAAQAAGIPWQRITKQILQLGNGRRLRWFMSSVSDVTPHIAAELTGKKLLTTQLLRKQMLPAPEGARARNEDHAIELAERIGFPVVVKPNDRNRGEGVFARLEDAEAVRDAYAAARGFSENVLVEEHIAGIDHRLHVFNGSVYRARIRTPGGVAGDGRLTVGELLEALNADPERGQQGSMARLIRIETDGEAERMLAAQSLSWRSVPSEGQFVALRSIANVSTGGVTTELPLERIHPDNIAMAERAVGLFGLDIAAVDFICPDIGRSWMDVGGGICEINAGPQFGEDAAEKLLASLFPDKGRIPVGLVLGDESGPDWLARLRTQLVERGVSAGIVADGEVWLGGSVIARLPPNSGFEGAMLLLRERRVEQLIVKLDSSFLTHGVPCEGIDWLAVDRTEMDDEGMALTSLVAPFVDSLLVNDGLGNPVGKAAPARKVAPGQWVDIVLAMGGGAPDKP